MIKQQYQDYLDSEEWKKTKLRYTSSGGKWECRICKVKKELNLHHRSYDNLGSENIKKEVVVLCRLHHAMIHWDDKTGKVPLDYYHLYKREQQIYREYNSLLSKIGRYRLGTLTDYLWGKVWRY